MRSYLIGEGIAPDNISARGFGKDNPVASNDNAAGRQKNRRVEMVVSGDIIGTPTGPPSKPAQSAIYSLAETRISRGDPS